MAGVPQAKFPMIPELTLIKAGTGVLTKSADGTLDKAALSTSCRPSPG